jgi:hypothetical protein
MLKDVLRQMEAAGIAKFEAPAPKTAWFVAKEYCRRENGHIKARVEIDEAVRVLRAAGYRVDRCAS